MHVYAMNLSAWLVLGFAFAAADAVLAQPANPPAAASYPARTVRVVVGFPPGGGVDLMARIFSQRLAAALGQPFIVETRAGAAGNIAADHVAKAPADGHTLLVTSTVHPINASLFSKLPFDPVKDFAPVSSLASAPDGIAVHPSVPARSLAELVKMAKSRPDALSYASAGSGTVMHVGMELFLSMAAIKMLHVPYNGSGPSTVAVLGGQVAVLSTSLGSALNHARAGKLRMLAVTSAQRTPLAPEYPTAAEALPLPGYEAITWLGMLAPAGTPPAIVSRLNAELGRALEQREVREVLASNAYDPFPNSPAAFANLIRAELSKWGKVIRDTGTKVD
ncbi:MAG: tripartite tricarboxylate transporter substrate binding protein [Burkholderiales bacterium]|nr:tripartite tricarboxylate transporter substrate binding protein [Burkholderiales bacterium]